MAAPAYSECTALAPANGSTDGLFSKGLGHALGPANIVEKLSLGGGLLSKSCLCLQIDNTVAFMCPSPPSPTEAVPDTLVTGHAVLNLARPRKIKSFTVTLSETIDILFANRPPESRVSLSQELSLPLPVDTKTGEVPAGVYALPFQFRVPGNGSPSQRCRHGRIHHAVKAVAKGAGRLGSSIEAEKRISLTAYQSWHDPQRNMTLDMQWETVSNELGPYRVSMHSTLFVVSGLVLLRFSIPSPPQSIAIDLFRVSLLATWTLIATDVDPLTGRPYTETPPVEVIPIAVVDSARPPDSANPPQSAEGVASGNGVARHENGREPLAKIEAGESWEMMHLVRLPKDDVIRPSTYADSQSAIRCSHMIQFEVFFFNGDGDRKYLSIKKPVLLSSCCCLLASVLLPSYDEKDPAPWNADLRMCAETNHCLCGQSLQKVKSSHDPSKYLDGPCVPDVVVPIKSDEERDNLSPSAFVPSASSC